MRLMKLPSSTNSKLVLTNLNFDILTVSSLAVSFDQAILGGRKWPDLAAFETSLDYHKRPGNFIIIKFSKTDF